VRPTRFRRHRPALAAGTLVLAALLAPRAAGAEILVRVDGSADVAYGETSATLQSTSRLSSDVRPTLTLQFGSPRLAWRVGYAFVGSLTLRGTDPHTYSNRVGLALTAELGPRSDLTVAGEISQGGTLFQLSQRPADAGEPAFRAPGDPARVEARLGEMFTWHGSEELRLREGLTGAVSAPQDAPERFEAAVTGSLRLERLFSRDAVGAEYRPRVAVLRPLTADATSFVTIANAFLGTWNHDFSPDWNAEAAAGLEQVVTFAGSYPLAIVPAGTLTARYLGRRFTGSVTVTSGAATDVQTGTVSMSEALVVRGTLPLDGFLPRALSASAGVLHASPLGEATSRVPAGIGDALQADVGLVWSLSESLIATARYTVAYQFDQPGGLQPSLAHLALVGLTARWSNAPALPELPSAGRRVDGADATGSQPGGAP
jgi:hypothetical protein